MGMSTQAPSPSFVPQDVPLDARVGIAAARFNEKLVDELLAGCRRRLNELGVDDERTEIHRVPGAFELPLAAGVMAQTKRFKAIICLGAVVRGETPHFDYVAGQCAAGIAQVSLAEKLPIIFGVLTTDTEQQAWDRCGGKHGHAGQRAAEAALEMIVMVRKVERG
jgi:6,7-dimethyl-8-ribityllumazine synthase